jgi:precorrin-6A synthase
MRSLSVIGIGAGNPDHLTVQAINALNALDVIFVIDKGSTTDELVQLRHEICLRYIDRPSYRVVELVDPPRDRASPGYNDAVADWHERRAEQWEHAIEHQLGEHEHGGFLVWGDPSLYDSTLRIIDRLVERARVAFRHHVIPGITSVQALAAQHRISLHEVGEAVTITTGRNLRAGVAPTTSTTVMLDADCSFGTLDPDAYDIWWGAYLGTPDEILEAGALRDVGPAIVDARAHARAGKGWVMDTYLLRPRPPQPT